MSQIEHPLRKVGLTILQDWAMMLVDPPQEHVTDIFESEEDLFASIVEVNGVVTGCLSIIAPRTFLGVLTKNLLGSDEVPTKDEQEDAFREMGNVLAGNFITEAYGADCVFDLLAPHVEECGKQLAQEYQRSKLSCTFIADEQPVLFHFSLEGSS